MNIIQKFKLEVDQKRANQISSQNNIVQNDTITFDDNNTIQSISAGDAKASLDRSKVSNQSIEEILSQNNNESIDKVSLDFEFNNSSEMINNIDSLKELIDHASNKWGISPNLIAAIISQESSGGTSSDNIMQIEFNQHKNEVKKIYDFEQGKEISLVLTENENDPKYANVNIKITKKDLENPKTAISIGTAILANCMQDINFNIPLGLQEYNLGPTGIRDVVQETARKNNTTTERIYNDQTNTNFRDYTYITGNGDPDYVKNVAQYLNIYNKGEKSSVIEVKGYNPYTKEIINQKVDFIPSGKN